MRGELRLKVYNPDTPLLGKGRRVVVDGPRGREPRTITAVEKAYGIAPTLKAKDIFVDAFLPDAAARKLM